MTKKYYSSVFLGICFFYINYSMAQDPQFTQFYAQPLYLNPAFAGSAVGGRLIANFRNQWPSLDANFRTYAFSYDQYIPKTRIGLGFLVKKDQQTRMNSQPSLTSSGQDFSNMYNGFQTTDFSLFVNYIIPIKYDMALQIGLGTSYVLRDAGWNNFVFGNQIGAHGQLNGQPAPNLSSENRLSFFDLALGGLLYTSNLWIGISATHLTTPNQSFFSEIGKLSVKYSLHAGYKIPIDEQTNRNFLGNFHTEKSITPVVNYFYQGGSEQLSVGAYMIYSPVMVGLWYRGLPIKFVENGADILNHDAVAVMVGFQWNSFALTYSYDYTISTLDTFSEGSHEIAIRYIIKTSSRRPENEGHFRIFCPGPSNFGIPPKSIPKLNRSKIPKRKPLKRNNAKQKF